MNSAWENLGTVSNLGPHSFLKSCSVVHKAKKPAWSPAQLVCHSQTLIPSQCKLMVNVLMCIMWCNHTVWPLGLNLHWSGTYDDEQFESPPKMKPKHPPPHRSGYCSSTARPLLAPVEPHCETSEPVVFRVFWLHSCTVIGGWDPSSISLMLTFWYILYQYITFICPGRYFMLNLCCLSSHTCCLMILEGCTCGHVRNHVCIFS